MAKFFKDTMQKILNDIIAFYNNIYILKKGF